MSASYNQTLASMANLYQSGFAKSMGQSTGMSSGNTIMNMMKSSLTGTGSGFMTNPNNPLQGISALSGIGNFANNIQAIGAARQMGLLPSTSGYNGNSGYGLSTGLNGLVGGYGSGYSSYGQTSSDPMQQLVAMLMSMIGMLGGGQQTGSMNYNTGSYGTNYGLGYGQSSSQTGFGQTSGFGSGSSLFSGVSNYSGIDAGIQYGLSGVANTLSLIGLSV